MFRSSAAAVLSSRTLVVIDMIRRLWFGLSNGDLMARWGAMLDSYIRETLFQSPRRNHRTQVLEFTTPDLSSTTHVMSG